MNRVEPDSLRVRPCPLCGWPGGRTVFDLEAEEFCRVNWTYSRDYRSILGLPTPAHFPIDQCAACGFLFARLLPTPGFLRTVYEKVIQSEECRQGSENGASYSRRLRYVATLIALTEAFGKTAARALDFGAGLGVTLRILEACGLEAWGLDPSPSRQSYALGAGSHVAAAVDEIRASGPFDLLVCDNVLEHLPDPRGAIGTLGKLLAPGAVAFVSVPDYGPAMLGRQLTAHRLGRPLDMTLNPWEHLSYFTAHHLDSVLADAGLRRLPASDIDAPVNIGLRPERSRMRRFKNAAASLLRLGRYATTGRAAETTEAAFYRKE